MLINFLYKDTDLTNNIISIIHEIIPIQIRSKREILLKKLSVHAHCGYTISDGISSSMLYHIGILPIKSLYVEKVTHIRQNHKMANRNNLINFFILQSLLYKNNINISHDDRFFINKSKQKAYRIDRLCGSVTA